jgi:hypothetical protein
VEVAEDIKSPATSDTYRLQARSQTNASGTVLALYIFIYGGSGGRFFIAMAEEDKSLLLAPLAAGRLEHELM